MNSVAPGALVGLNETEAAVYLAVLRGGRLSHAEIARATGYNRTTLYGPIRSLLRQDLIKKTIRGKRVYYAAANPERLVKQASKKVQHLEAILPTLVRAFENSGHKPIISIHEGADAIYSTLLQFAEQAPYLKSFAAPAEYLQVLTRQQANEMVALMERRNIRSTTLTSNTKENLDIVATFKSPNLEWRAMPGNISYPIEITFATRTALIISWQHQFVVVVESSDIVAFIEAVYDYFWGVAGPLKSR